MIEVSDSLMICQRLILYSVMYNVMFLLAIC